MQKIIVVLLLGCISGIVANIIYNHFNHQEIKSIITETYSFSGKNNQSMKDVIAGRDANQTKHLHNELRNIITEIKSVKSEIKFIKASLTSYSNNKSQKQSNINAEGDVTQTQ